MARKRTSGNGTALLIAAGIIVWIAVAVGKFVEANAVVLVCAAAAAVIAFIVYRLLRAKSVTRPSPGVDRRLEPAMAHTVSDQAPRREPVQQATEPLATPLRDFPDRRPNS